MSTTRQLVKDGAWLVPESERPAGWQSGFGVVAKPAKPRKPHNFRKPWKNCKTKAGRKASKEWWGRYNAHLKSEKWKAFRAFILRDRGNVCERCFSGKRLEIHHKTYDRIGHEDPADVEVLCKSCHDIETTGKL